MPALAWPSISAGEISMHHRPFAFTLIELLIVVAIIAILAAIAVPNFLEAQTRSKVSRCLADQRSVAVGFESYHVDNQDYPPLGVPNGFQTWAGWWLDACYYLTTPIAYLSSTEAMLDPFEKPPHWSETDIYKTNSYIHYDLDGGRGMSPRFAEKGLAYLVQSFGPASIMVTDNGAAWGFVPYDATNGTVSLGQIMYYGPGGLRALRSN